MRARFANMVMGMLTRESVRDAFGNGITADQIISFMTAHAHAEMRKQSPVVPETIMDQIKLWEMETNRMRTSPGKIFGLKLTLFRIFV